MRITHGGKCDAVWSGLRVEHCPACHETFTGAEAGDAHRIVVHEDERGSETRRCLTVDEMRAKTIETGAGKGESWFVEDKNTYGTRLWSRNRPGRAPNPFSLTGGLDSGSLVAHQGTGGPTQGLAPQAPVRQEAV